MKEKVELGIQIQILSQGKAEIVIGMMTYQELRAVERTLCSC